MNLLYKSPDTEPVSLRSDLVMGVAEKGHWWTKRQFQLFLQGKAPRRDGPLEKILKRLEKRKLLKTVQYKVNENKYYAVPRTKKGFIPYLHEARLYHGLACTECLVRFYRSDMNCSIEPERSFRGNGSVPEWGIKYPKGTMLLCEFSTKHDVEYPLTQIGKFQAYERSLPDISDAFDAKPGVVFIWDLPRQWVMERIARWKPQGPYWFIDWASFLDIPLGDALTSPLYFRSDGRTEALNFRIPPQKMSPDKTGSSPTGYKI